ncbi:uncharacterized protein LOC111831220 [Capsella rubella]|uniref:uncharacterized protein LOC111831220 n=1 Tax=Capsella rubella TaxID=81985 RepID=UPI000CD58414|nr:uncharacterized protein LOC111831220 [Capsella rubella]XP_023640904.1 uncharacterized protein LOC111831220 [Capsella rubella]
MDCNRDEAKRAMDVAELKITEKDYNGAKKFANKAQILFPELHGLKKLMTAIDVYIAGEKLIGGEVDWYGVLGVDPYANDDAVKKQYHKLLLVLHPDKNKCNYAKGAYDLVIQAKDTLTKEPEKAVYIEKRRKEEAQRSRKAQSVKRPRQPTSKAAKNVRKPVVQNVKARAKSTARMERSHVPSPAHAFVVPSSMAEQSTQFWTQCLNCKNKYLFERIYLNKNLRCQECGHGFFAKEIPRPPNASMLPVNNLSSTKLHMDSNYYQASRSVPSPSVKYVFQGGPSSKVSGFNSWSPTNQAAGVVQQEQVAKEFWESQERDAARGFASFDVRSFKRPKIDGSNIHGGDQVASNQTGARIVSNGNTETRQHPRALDEDKGDGRMVLPNRALIGRGKAEIRKRLQEMISDVVAKVIAPPPDGEKKSMNATSKMSGKADEVGRSVEETPRVALDEDKDDEVETIIID